MDENSQSTSNPDDVKKYNVLDRHPNDGLPKIPSVDEFVKTWAERMRCPNPRAHER